MSQPALILTQLDNQLGIVRPSVGRRPVAVVGVSSSGTVGVATPLTRVSDLTATFGDGPGVEAAAAHIRAGNTVVFVRTGQTVDGAFLDSVSAEDGTIEGFDDGTGGASVITVNSTHDLPSGAYSVQVVFAIGGTVGVAGIVYQVSVNGGDTFGLAQPLGTDTNIDLSSYGIGDVWLDLTSDTITAGRIVSFTTTAPIEASAGELNLDDWTGTSTPTINSTPLPIDDYEVRVRVRTGGTIGVTGIELQYSYDDGRTYEPKVALGTAAFYTIPGAGRVNFGAGDVEAGDELAFPTVAPQWNSSELTAGMTVLRNLKRDFEQILVVGPMAPSDVTLVSANTSGMIEVGKNRYFRGSTRLPVGGESDATYQASLGAAFANSASIYGDMCAGACEFPSAVSGRKYRRPAAWVVSVREAQLAANQNAADSSLGGLDCQITDDTGAPKHHDETLSPGLDDLRFTCLRTIEGEAGVFINRARAFAPEGSDFSLSTYVRVMIIARDTLQVYFRKRLNQLVRVDGKTGKITELNALEIESGANAALAGRGLNGRLAVRARFVLSREDNVLSTRTLTGQCRVIPFGYAEFFNVDVGYENPALQVRQAA